MRTHCCSKPANISVCSLLCRNKVKRRIKSLRCLHKGHIFLPEHKLLNYPDCSLERRVAQKQCLKSSQKPFLLVFFIAVLGMNGFTSRKVQACPVCFKCLS